MKMSVWRFAQPLTRHFRTLGGAFYQNARNHTFYAKEPYKAKYHSFDQQSILLPGPDRIRASVLVEDPSNPVGCIPGSPEVKTVYDMLIHGLKVSNDGPCTGTRPPGSQEYQWSSYSSVVSRTQNIGSGFMELGIKPKSDSYIGTFASNQEEYLITMLSCAGYSMTLVPLHLTLSLPSLIYCVNHVKLSLMIANNNQNASIILNNSKDLPSIKTLVMYTEPTEEHMKLARENNIRILTYSELEEIGKANRKDLVIPNIKDVFCIPFTSGTTGIPKGVMITHENAIACVLNLLYAYGETGRLGGVIMSYLPGAHIYEICNIYASLYFARGIGFYSGDIKSLMAEVRILKPNVLCLVPRLMNNIYLEVMKKVKGSAVKTAVLKAALWHKEKLIKRGKTSKNTFWDKYVFKEFQELLGGEATLITSTSAPLETEIRRFFALASGAFMYEIYGGTEMLGSTMTLPGDISCGHVGGPLPSNHVKLVDVPEMDYFSKDDTGEICMKGFNVCSGYFKNPEATKAAMVDGWYHSGDIGKWLPNGTLKVIDRKKNLFKLSQGIYIAPEKVENAYSFCNLVLQILVDGIPGKDFVIALVVPEPTLFSKWLVSKGYNPKDGLSDILKVKELRKDFLKELHKQGTEKHLNSLEQARNLAFLTEGFTIDNGMLTPTFKIKRNEARKHHEHIYHKLYEEGQLIASLKS